METPLRSSPTPEGRCCVGALDDLGRCLEVAILTDPGGPVLPAYRRQRPRRLTVAILTDPGGPVLHGKR